MSLVLGVDLVTQEIFGNFKETLNDCERLLNDQRYFQKHHGFVSNIYSHHQIDPEMQKLRERIAFHNIKVIAHRKDQQSD